MLKFLKDDPHRGGRDGGRGRDFGDDDRASESFSREPPKGFGVQVPVAIDKAIVGPIIVPCVLGEGGVQVSSFIYQFFVLVFLYIKNFALGSLVNDD